MAHWHWDRPHLISLISPIEGLLYLPNVRAIQYKLGPERLTWLGNSNVLRLPVDCKCVFKRPSMQRWQYLIHKGILKRVVLSSINFISMLIVLKTVYFQLGFLYKSDLRISTNWKHYQKYSFYLYFYSNYLKGPALPVQKNVKIKKHSPATHESAQKSSAQSVQPVGRLYAKSIWMSCFIT